MDKLTTYERTLRTYQHKDVDRVPIFDGPWAGTVRRWINEGMPKDISWQDYFQTDKQGGIGCDVSPRFEETIIEKTKRYTIYKTNWGVTLKQLNEEDSTPEYIDFTVVNKDEWEKAKKNMQVSKDRIDFKYLEDNFSKWRNEGRWIVGGFWFGFDVTHSWMVGTETLLIAMLEEPEWVKDMFNTYLDMCIAHFNMIWDAGYHFDCISWPDDMGYKNTPFFSTQLYKDLLQPVHKRAVDWAHSKGIYAHLHSCGDIMPLMDDIMKTGIDALNPIEIKAGMDINVLKDKYGKDLVLHGGINAVLWDDHDAIINEIKRCIPILNKDGGYIFASDHSIPNSVSLNNFRDIVNTVKELTKN